MKIRDKLHLAKDSTIHPEPTPPTAPHPLLAFSPVSESEMLKLMRSSPSKSCDLDPCPTQIVKDCADILAVPITKVVNLSLAEGKFPDSFKLAHVTPLIKKTSLDRNELNNFRPVSGLNFVSKLVEKVVANQIKSHMQNSGMTNTYQSAYKAGHSTETALLYIQNDILSAQDRGELTALALLDLSAAFDTIDHNLLLGRLTEWFGIDGVVLQWVRSYLTGRSQLVKIDGELSTPQLLLCGVPQGSVLGPLLFTMYTTPLSSIITSFGLKHHLYADDTQIYTSFSADNISQSIIVLQNCTLAIQVWMNQNMLKLNPDKTELMVIGNIVQRKKVANIFPVDLLSQKFANIACMRNLGVAFDPGLSFKKHISNICKSAFYHIRDLRRIRIHLNKATAISIANALVSSRLDYCNSLLLGCSEKHKTILQRVQNCLARVVTRSSRFSESKPLLKSLHWLPIKSRITFKLNLLTYKALSTGTPSYLSELLHFKHRQQTLRSETIKLLHPGPRPKRNYGYSSFEVAAPRLWNSLPIHIREAESVFVFRKYLKTHLFTLPP